MKTTHSVTLKGVTLSIGTRISTIREWVAEDEFTIENFKLGQCTSSKDGQHGIQMMAQCVSERRHPNDTREMTQDWYCVKCIVSRLHERKAIILNRIGGK